MNLPSSVGEARKQGTKQYFTSKPCKNGHVAPRFTSTRHCVVCGRNDAQQWYRNNVDREAARNRAYRLNNFDRARGSRLKRLYGLTLEQFDAMFEAQEGRCLGCTRSIVKHRAGKARAQRDNACVDHCHASGKLRGILCNLCNSTLGKTKDNPDTLRRLADYLEKHQPIT